MRTPLVIGNWKMNGTVAEARLLASAVCDGLKRPKGTEVVLCPPFTALAAVSEIVAGSPIGLGAQSCHAEPSGAHTGEIAPPMLVELGCRLVLLGHSERRKEMGETDEQVNRKVVSALAHGLTPVLCVGESGDERRQGLTFTTVEGQLRAGLAGLDAAAITRTIFAYEPVWAIGTGDAASAEDAQEVCAQIRRILRETDHAAAAEIPIQYGGSVTAENAAELFGQPDIDGALVGGASLKPDVFAQILRAAAGT